MKRLTKRPSTGQYVELSVYVITALQFLSIGLGIIKAVLGSNISTRRFTIVCNFSRYYKIRAEQDAKYQLVNQLSDGKIQKIKKR